MATSIKKTLKITSLALCLGSLTSTVFAVLPTVGLDPNVNPDSAAINNNTANSNTTNTNNNANTVNSNANNGFTVQNFAQAPTNPAATQQPTVLLAVPATIQAVNPATSQINSRILASIVSQDAQGQEVLSPVTAQTRLTSGNIIEYRGYITNNSPERVRNMKVTYQLPANTELLGMETISPSHAYGSMDGQNFQYMPLKTNIGGTLQNLPMAYYKALQWDIPGLGLNEVAVLKYRLKIK